MLLIVRSFSGQARLLVFFVMNLILK